MVATKDEPTDPLDPTKYPSEYDFATNFCAIRYNTAYPLLIIEFSSLSNLF